MWVTASLYLVDMLGIATGEIGLRFIDEFCWVRSHVAPARVGPGKMPDGWLRCLHLSPSSSPETHPEQVQRGDGNGKSGTVSPSNVFVLPPERGADRDEDTPVDLVRRFVRYCTRPGGIVCDPLATPATPLAAMREGRRYVCFQSNRARYHAIMASVAGEEENAQRGAPVNPVNDLSPAEWMRFGASVWSVPKSAEERRITTEGEHPAVMSLELCTRLIRCLLPPTDEGPVLDPFCGLGSTLLAAKRLNKRSIGIEISEDYARLAGERAAREPASTARVDIHCADIRDVADLLEPGSVSMVLTSPPFWNVLDLKRTSDERPVRTYRKAAASLASISGYKRFVAALGRCFTGIERVCRPGAPCVVEVMDLQRGPDFYPFHIDVCNAITRRTDMYLADAVVWDRTTDYNDQKPLRLGPPLVLAPHALLHPGVPQAGVTGRSARPVEYRFVPAVDVRRVHPTPLAPCGSVAPAARTRPGAGRRTGGMDESDFGRPITRPFRPRLGLPTENP